MFEFPLICVVSSATDEQTFLWHRPYDDCANRMCRSSTCCCADGWLAIESIQGGCHGRRRTPVYARGMRRKVWLAVGVAALYAGLVVGFVPFYKTDESCGSAFLGNPNSDPLFNCDSTRSTLQLFSLVLLVIGFAATAMSRPIRALRARVASPQRQILAAATLLFVGLAVLAILLVTVWFILLSRQGSYS
jgi:hypothetical protein